MKKGFAFLVHPREIKEIALRFPLVKFIPTAVLGFFARNMWPVVVSEITGFKDLKGEPVRGWLVGITMTAEQMLANRELTNKRIIQAINLAEQLGAGIVGLGAITSSVTDGGRTLKGRVNIGLTTGNTLTALVTYWAIENIARLKMINFNEIEVAIVGATGSIGSAVANLVAGSNCPNLILVGRTPEHLEKLKSSLLKLDCSDKITVTNDISKIRNSLIVIVATSAPGALIHSEHLRRNAIVYDITQPQNVSYNVVKERTDVTLIDGGLIKVPNVNLNFKIGLPHGVVFACLAETMILAGANRFDNFSLGEVNTNNFEFMKNKFQEYKFELFR